MDKNRLKEVLRHSRMFFLVDRDVLATPDDWAEYLDSILHGNCYIAETDRGLILVEQRRLVDTVRGIKIEIFPLEHTPPHFHVKSAKIDASFRIVDCTRLNGSISHKDELVIRYWWQYAKPYLIGIWNETRPTDCIVGEYQEST